MNNTIVTEKLELQTRVLAWSMVVQILQAGHTDPSPYGMGGLDSSSDYMTPSGTCIYSRGRHRVRQAGFNA